MVKHKMENIIWTVLLFTVFFYNVRSQNAQPPSSGGGSRPYSAPTVVNMETFRKQLLYPHEESHLVTRITRSNTMHDVPLTFRLPFFGFEFRYIWVNKDGHLSFNKGLLDYDQVPIKFPTQHINNPDREEDPSIIAPWFSQQDIPGTIKGAGVYFYLVNMGTEKNESLKERLRLDFRDGMIGASEFVPTYALIVTWKNVTFANRQTDRELKTNTYQVVIATDEKRTYAMFNYAWITWITHRDNFDGLKGTAAFIGFNAGNRTRAYEFEPYSQQPRVSRITKLGFGNNLEGRFFFQIDEEIWPGCCIERDLDVNWATRPRLTFLPRYGNMLGGTLVNLTGPCIFNNQSIIRCKFDTLETEGYFRTKNHVSCLSPPLMYHGYVDLTVSIDNGPFLFYGRYYIQPPDMVKADIVVLRDQDRQEKPEEFVIQWDHLKLTHDFRAGVTIALWGYRETNDNYPQLTYIDTIMETSVQSAEPKVELDLDTFRNRWNWETLDIFFGFIAVNLTSTEVLGKGIKKSPVLWSAPMPLAWYFRPQWEKHFGSDWKEEICEDWYYREKYSDRFAITLFRCPCTLEQAMLDRGRFAPDLQCNEIDRKCETFHKTASHCVRSGRPAVGGAGQLCCYDDHGELIRTGDTMYGGRPARAFQYGKHPFKQKMMIPTLSYWLHDVAPFFFCCKWAEGQDDAESCSLFKFWRTSQDCSLYQTPGVSSVFGDPHYVTFDRVNYTFNGKGEFVLTRVNHEKHKLDIQGRFEQPLPKHYGELPINGTRLMAVAAKDNLSSIVEFRVRPEAARWHYHMYIIVDQEYVYFWDNSLRIQYFKGVTLYQPAKVYNMSHIVAMFDSGAGVEVMVENGQLAAHVYLPLTYLNKTAGLLGNWSRRREDEFSIPGEENPLPWTSKTYDIHHKFGSYWRVNEIENDRVGRSLFFHDAVSFTEYDDQKFVPEYERPPQVPKERTLFKMEVESVCRESLPCQYDFIVTGDRDFALATRNHENYAQKLAADVRKPEIRCPELARPRNGRKTDLRYSSGITVRFTCNEGYRLVGYANRKCRSIGLWSWGVDPECISEAEYTRKVAGISSGIVIPLLIIGIVIGCFIVAHMRQRREHWTNERGMPTRTILEMKSNAQRNGPPMETGKKLENDV